MRVVAIMGKKGGNGKSTVSHLLALGSYYHDIPAVLVHTDDRELDEHKERPYSYIDGREAGALASVLEKHHEYEGLLIIDSGGNRGNVDKVISKYVDLVILPCETGGQSAKQVLADLKELPEKKTWVLVNRYPFLAKRKNKADKYISQLPADKIIGKIVETPAMDRLTEDDVEPWITPSSKVNNRARALFIAVNRKLLSM